ncbi:MAG: cytochrome C oxidase subunit IV family protein [Gemmatimonadota bacterium]
MQGNGETAHPPYLFIWGVLAVLMFAKVGVSLVGMARWMSVTLLVMISFLSALLVALYYMHLRFEPRKLWVLAAIPLPLIVILLALVMQDFR